jgi:ferredoxin-type protein NapF
LSLTMRLVIRILVLVIAAVFATQIIPVMVERRLEAESLTRGGTGIVASTAVTGRTLALFLPALSPFSAVSSAVAKQSVGWVFILCLPVLVMGILKGRWFCFHLCPTGFLAELAGKLRPGSKSKFVSMPRVGGIIVLFAVGGAILGYPLFLWLDPLCIFNGFFSIWHSPIVLFTILPAVGLVLIIALSIWRPNSWCYRFCPLGFSQELLGKAWRHVLHVHTRKEQVVLSIEAGHKPDTGLGRRIFLALIVGGISGFATRKVFGKQQPIRPPGAITENQFTALCIRCGNCVRACPKKIIFPDLGQSGVAGLLTPVLRIDPNYCAEWCNECTKVCPTGAITRLSLADKNNLAIGTALVTKSRCLAWEKSQACMVCDEYCPFHAIKTIKNGEVLCPEVDPEICRGCGFCQAGCPAEQKAIIVHGKAQRKLAHVTLQGT